MAQDNNVTLVGNATRDPELRFTSSGIALCTFGLAVNKRKFNKQTQEYDESVSFFNVTAWREMAENVAESVQKGSRVIVTGALEQRSWETDEGEKRSAVEIQADDVGTSLRWASAQVTRNERKAASGDYQDTGGGYGGGDEPF